MTKKPSVIPHFKMKPAKFRPATVSAHVVLIIIIVPISKMFLKHKFRNISYTMCIFLHDVQNHLDGFSAYDTPVSYSTDNDTLRHTFKSDRL